MGTCIDLVRRGWVLSLGAGPLLVKDELRNLRNLPNLRNLRNLPNLRHP
jgi:hypothetical protein